MKPEPAGKVKQGTDVDQLDVVEKASNTVVPSWKVYGNPGVPPRSHTGRLNLRAPPGAAMSIRGP